MRSISRVADVSINTVSKLLVDAGKACAAFHDDGRWHQPNALERDGYSEHGGSGGPEAGKARPL